jgi:hypothetical protein
MTDIPKSIPNCDEWPRNFPEEWKGAYWRLHVRRPEFLYECPICHGSFGISNYNQLQCDYIRPYSSFIKGVDTRFVEIAGTYFGSIKKP